MKADIVVDIETIVNPVTTLEVEKFMLEYSPPGNYKDPVKIEEHRKKAQENAVQSIIDDKRFTIHGKKMISCALGVANSYSGEVENVRSQACDDVGVICTFIRDYLNEYPEKRLIGWNHLGFDYPEIIKSFYLSKVGPPRTKIDKWDFIDLCDKPPYRKMKLKHTAAAFGIPVLDVDGSSVAGLYEAGNWTKIREYNEYDVVLTGKLFIAAHGWQKF